jgi:hypothetical protein
MGKGLTKDELAKRLLQNLQRNQGKVLELEQKKFDRTKKARAYVPKKAPAGAGKKETPSK